MNLSKINENTLPRVLDINVSKILQYYNIPKSKVTIKQYLSSRLQNPNGYLCTYFKENEF
jgi:hypothetical protein